MGEAIGFEVRLNEGYAEAMERVTDALSAEGFGVLSRIDVHEAFQKKLGITFRPYSILGACNPQLAHQALSGRPDVGLLLPCNVTVEESEGGSLVRIIDPAEMMRAGGMDADSVLAKVGREARERLARVAAALAESA